MKKLESYLDPHKIMFIFSLVFVSYLCSFISDVTNSQMEHSKRRKVAF